MNTKTIGIVLGLLWVAAIVWVVLLWQGETPTDPDGPQDSAAVDVLPDRDRPVAADGSAASGSGESTPPDVREPKVVDLVETSTGAGDATETDDGPGPDPSSVDDVDDGTESPAVVLGDPDPYERKILRQIFDPLEDAAQRYSKHDDLEESTFFGEDQESNQAAIDRLLDEAIETLGLSSINETRGRLRAIRGELDAAEERLSRDREARLSAPFDSEVSTLEKPFTTTREDYEERIEDTEESIARLERERTDLESEFVDELRSVGLEVSPETARGLLSTVSGEDFVEMCVVFHNVRLVTVRLQQLTEEAGESLDVARRYYGSYVVLVRILDTIQKDFVRRVREDQVPRLAEYSEKARENIAQAKRNLKDGGDPAIAAQNIRSNELTLDACLAYSRYLLDQADAVARQNEELQPRLRDAINTFETVQLSSQVANAIREARRNFSALLELQVPDLRGFENVELQQEFERLTDQLLEP
ncbi:hypothetical protein Pla163_15530 [Planctomycetes bacterium Pla163]|uniref:Uncharacterized protein n=1 Tax=Rohdeia mirabilis TaxID=2528008 RepID=A0A518CYZ0_9BACT|nr:hypothetical protein Pla163_15530 [Planctomycetes bacterium Pla163]